jgi:hypothetical protein
MENNEKLAILDALLNDGYSVMTEDIVELIDELKEELDTLDSNSNRYDEIIEELEEYDDYVGPDDLHKERYKHYGLNVYSISKLRKIYCVGTTDEADSALKSSLKAYITDEYSDLNEYVSNHVENIKRFIDIDKLRDELYSVYSDSVHSNISSHFDDNERYLSPQQEELVEILENRIAKYKTLKSKQSNLSKIKDIDLVITKLKEKINKIKENPKGGIPIEKIEELINDYVDNDLEDLESLFFELNSYDIEDYFDLNKYISFLSKKESYSSLSYDGDYYETKINGINYIVIRTQ